MDEAAAEQAIYDAKRYRTIVVDPPWKYQSRWGRKDEWTATGHTMTQGTDRGAETQYDCMEVDDIAAVPVGEWAESDAHLYLWVTNAFMEAAHALARTWGFEQKTILTWVKQENGMGYYFRNNTEHVLFCVRGSIRTLRRDQPTAFHASRTRHSEKPAAFYDMVESMSPGPYLDVFARKLRFNWDAWGDEVGAPPGLPTPDQVRARSGRPSRTPSPTTGA